MYLFVSNKSRKGYLEIMEKKTIFIFDAEPGMILASDVLAQDGSLIAASGAKLDLNNIAKLSDYHILEIDVEDRPIEPEQEEYVGLEKLFASSAEINNSL